MHPNTKKILFQIHLKLRKLLVGHWSDIALNIYLFVYHDTPWQDIQPIETV